MKTKEVFTVKVDGKDLELAVIRPTAQTMQEGNIEYGKTFNKLLRAGVILQQELDSELRKRGIWDDQKQSQYEKLQKTILDHEYKLDKGNIKVSEGRRIAIDMRNLRVDWQILMAERVALQTNTAESQADNARFHYLVQKCLVRNDTGEPYYKTLDEYYQHSNDEIALVGAIKFSALTNEYDENMEANLPENKFLKEWGFIDDKLRLIDKNGKLVNEDGNLIDDEGFKIDDKGNRLDINGNPVSKDGSYAVEKMPFLDEDGKPIVKDKPAEQPAEVTVVESPK